MPNEFTIKEVYLLSAIDKKGERVYFAIDQHSGGYPYWSTYVSSAAEFKSLTQIPDIGRTDYMRNGVTCIDVLKVVHQATVVESTEIISRAKAKALAEIEKIQKDLASKIAAIESMK